MLATGVASLMKLKLRFVGGGVDGVHRGSQQQRVAVWGRTHHRVGRNIGGGTRLVLDDKWLTESLGQPLAQQPRQDVAQAAGRETGDDPHRSGRVILRPRKPRASPESNCRDAALKKPAASQFHNVLPHKGRL